MTLHHHLKYDLSIPQPPPPLPAIPSLPSPPYNAFTLFCCNIPPLSHPQQALHFYAFCAFMAHWFICLHPKPMWVSLPSCLSVTSVYKPHLHSPSVTFNFLCQCQWDWRATAGSHLSDIPKMTNNLISITILAFHQIVSSFFFFSFFSMLLHCSFFLSFSYAHCFCSVWCFNVSVSFSCASKALIYLPSSTSVMNSI